MIKEMRSKLEEDDAASIFLRGTAEMKKRGGGGGDHSIKTKKASPSLLVVHSPLIRAVKTYRLMIKPVLLQKYDNDDVTTAGQEDKDEDIPSLILPAAAISHQHVICLPLLSERTFKEHLMPKPFEKRVCKFEKWLDSRHETNIVVIGHSKFFKRLLGNACSSFKFANCDIWEYSRIYGSDENGQCSAVWKEVERRYFSDLSIP
mmetsp:Transcript_35054/g.48798  ORF Transcript_35054/g.48798 Transcript_35054/m.48798 type:complete len:204 (+) Transcript_35054:612-1223(+)